jgi:TetR/AcrR family transcriptional repressor of nem operon
VNTVLIAKELITMARPREFLSDQVIDAAMEEFWQHGYTATSSQNLVDATGLGRGSLYNAFNNKHGLYEQALQRYLQHTQRNVALLEQPGQVKPLIRQLLMDIVDEELHDSRKRGCLAANATLEPSGRDKTVIKLIRQNFLLLEQALERVVVRGQASGEIGADKNARAVASFVLNTIQGIRVLGKVTQKQETRLTDIVETMMLIF